MKQILIGFTLGTISICVALIIFVLLFTSSTPR